MRLPNMMVRVDEPRANNLARTVNYRCSGRKKPVPDGCNSRVFQQHVCLLDHDLADRIVRDDRASLEQDGAGNFGSHEFLRGSNTCFKELVDIQVGWELYGGVLWV